MEETRIFRLFACCLPVRGASRSIVCDLQRHRYYFIPNDLYCILVDHADKTVAEIKAFYNEDSSYIIDSYFVFLLQKHLGFWCDEPALFPSLSLDWETPCAITNAIIDINASSAHDFASIFKQLDELGCRAVQLRFYCDWGIERIGQEILPMTSAGRLRSVELLLKFSLDLEANLDNLLAQHRRITSVIVHASPEDRVSAVQGVRILFRSEFIDSDRHCGQVHSGYFTPQIDFFVESQNFNSCLNRKLGIDARGEIKNCPSCERSFGNSALIKIGAVVNSSDFRSLWNISKDSVEICRDCEFRYICPDCRVFVSGESGLYSKPSKCSYDPYSARWL